ncbi:MAG: hypothetical protein ACO1N0_07650 [Fluviicola sp.]
MNTDQYLWDCIFNSETPKINQFLAENPAFNINTIHPELNTTPLITAIDSGDEKMVELILNSDANPNIIGSGMASALYHLVDLYMEAEDAMEGTARAIYGSVEKAIASGTYNVSTNENYLHMLVLLLDKGADMNQPNYGGETPYERAGWVPAAKRLFEQRIENSSGNQ